MHIYLHHCNYWHCLYYLLPSYTWSCCYHSVEQALIEAHGEGPVWGRIDRGLVIKIVMQLQCRWPTAVQLRVDTLQTAWIVGCGNYSILLSKLWVGAQGTDSDTAAFSDIWRNGWHQAVCSLCGSGVVLGATARTGPRWCVKLHDQPLAGYLWWTIWGKPALFHARYNYKVNLLASYINSPKQLSMGDYNPQLLTKCTK